MLRPVCFQTNSAAASKISSPQPRIAREWRLQPPWPLGPRAIRELKFFFGVLMNSNGEGSGCCAALSSSFSDNSKEPRLLATGVRRGDQVPFRSTNLIFALGLSSVVSVVWSSESGPYTGSARIVVDADAAARAPARKAPITPRRRISLAPSGTCRLGP